MEIRMGLKQENSSIMYPKKCIILILSLVFLSANLRGQARCITGNVSLEKAGKGRIVIQLYRLTISSHGKPRRLTKADVYGAAAAEATITLSGAGDFRFDNLRPGYYSIVAFQDDDENGIVNFDPPEAFGWFCSSEDTRFAPIDVRNSDQTDIDIPLRRPTPFSKETKMTDHGTLKRINGIPVLQLRGDHRQRGFAQGFLVGEQIKDFLEYYIIEDSWSSVNSYQEIFVPFLENNFNFPEEFLEECDGVIEGMQASGLDMRITGLDRDFCRTDLFAINSYIERRAAFPLSTPSSCTQFAFWGQRSSDGGLIAARNMDGECDVRKVTVSHFLLFAVSPAESSKKRWVSAMWPGFIGTISGVNEDGLYSMENAGSSGPGPVPEGIVPCSWIECFVLENGASGSIQDSIIDIMKTYTCSSGGITAAGSIILWALPYLGQPAPAFVYEGGRSGYAVRLPGDIHPRDEWVIMASNHHLKLGYDPDTPDYSLGFPVSFSSRWRYETGQQMLEAWARQNRRCGVQEAKQLLRSVAHGSTEYSVIFMANQKRILVAVDDLKADLWDAPYQNWKEFIFEDLFK